MRAKATGALFVCILLTQAAGRELAVRVTLKVIDEHGRPVAGAQAGIAYERVYARKSSEQVGAAEGITDADGRVTLEGKTAESGISYGVDKAGYYSMHGFRYHFKEAGAFRWQPWDPTIEVVLKRIRNPVPMYAKRLWRTGLPKRDEPVAYDLEIGDWVAPHGKGKTPDMIFIGTLREGGDRVYEWKLKLTFSNSGDGIQRFTPDSEPGSFRSPYQAPAEGYLPDWNLWRTRQGPEVREKNNYQEKGGYFFRVRTVLDSEGRVVKAMYGKIYGDFLAMVYYLNPDGTRNMEYDYKRNLLKWEDPLERGDYEVGP